MGRVLRAAAAATAAMTRSGGVGAHLNEAGREAK